MCTRMGLPTSSKKIVVGLLTAERAAVVTSPVLQRESDQAIRKCSVVTTSPVPVAINSDNFRKAGEAPGRLESLKQRVVISRCVEM